MPVVLPSANNTVGLFTGRPALHLALAMPERGGQSPGAGRWTKLQWLEQQLAEAPMPHKRQ